MHYRDAPSDSPSGTSRATCVLDMQVARNEYRKCNDRYIFTLRFLPRVRLQGDNRQCVALSVRFPFFIIIFFFFFSGNRSTRLDSVLRSLSRDGLSVRRPWPHFEYRTLAHGRWVDRRLSIHSIRSNSFNCVKHGRVEYFLYFRARARMAVGVERGSGTATARGRLIQVRPATGSLGT